MRRIRQALLIGARSHDSSWRTLDYSLFNIYIGKDPRQIGVEPTFRWIRQALLINARSHGSRWRTVKSALFIIFFRGKDNRLEPLYYQIAMRHNGSLVDSFRQKILLGSLDCLFSLVFEPLRSGHLGVGWGSTLSLMQVYVRLDEHLNDVRLLLQVL